MSHDPDGFHLDSATDSGPDQSNFGKRIFTNPLMKICAYLLVVLGAALWLSYAVREGAGELIGLDNAFVFELFPRTFAEEEMTGMVVVSLAIASMLTVVPLAAINSVEQDQKFNTSLSYMVLGFLVIFLPAAGAVFGLVSGGQLLVGKLPMSGGSSRRRGITTSYASYSIGSIKWALMILYLAVTLSWQPILLVWTLTLV